MARSGRPLKVVSELQYIGDYIKNNDLSGIKTLINEYGVDCFDSFGRTLLILAASQGHVSILKYLIEKGADINFKDKNGYSALHFAAQNSNAQIVEILLGENADVNSRDIHGNPPIWTAIFNSKNDVTIIKMLLEKNADIVTKNNHGKSPKEMWYIKHNKPIEDLMP